LRTQARVDRTRRHQNAQVTVAASVLAALRRAQDRVPAGYEVGGQVLVRRRPGRLSLIERFEEVPNLADEPGTFECEELPFAPEGWEPIMVHSHPCTDARPSPSDLDMPGRDFAAIFARRLHSLAVYRLDGNGGFERVPTVVERPAYCRQVSRPGATVSALAPPFGSH